MSSPVRKTRRTILHSVTSTPLHVAGLSLMAIAASMFFGAVIEWQTTDRDTAMLVFSGLVVGGTGLAFWLLTTTGRIDARSTFAAVGWTWIATTLGGAVPYLLCGAFDVPGIDWSGQIVNSVFESASGFSCTGSTALTDFSVPGQGLMMYRQMTQWFGGMGVVVLAVAVLPFLGVGGLELIAAEAPGTSGDRLTPRISDTAKVLWRLYSLLTVGMIIALVIVPGPSLYDAVAHSFSVASTGGFSPYADSIGYYDSVAVELVLIAGMVIGATNFAVHWKVLTGTPRNYWRDSEFRTLLSLLGGCVAIGTVLLWWDSDLSFASSLRNAAFNIVSLGTSTGYGNAIGPDSPGNFVTWAPSVQMILLFWMVVGGSTGSTSGGIKVLRLEVLVKHSVRTVRQAEKPHSVIPVRLGANPLSEDIVARVSSFFLIYLLLVITGVLAVTALGGGLLETVGAVVGSLGNMGPGLGNAGPTANFTEAFSEPARLVLAGLMVVGRLELFTVLLMFAASVRSLRQLKKE